MLFLTTLSVSFALILLLFITRTQLFEVGEVLGARGNTKAKKLRHGGTLFARITTAPVEEVGTLHVKMQGIKLQNTDGMFGKSDPFLEISAKVSAAGGLTWHPIYRSKPVMNDLNPKWPECSVDAARLCVDGNLNTPILVEVWDWEKSGKHVSMGKFETSINGLLQAQVGEPATKTAVVDMGKAFKLDKKGRDVGKIVVTTARLEGFVEPSAAAAQSSGFGSTPMADTATPTAFKIPESAPYAAAAAVSSSLPSFSEALDRPPPSFQTTAAMMMVANSFSNQKLSETNSSTAPISYVPVALPPPMAPPRMNVANKIPAGDGGSRPKFTDYLAGGCELDLCIAIDFTGSNGDPRKPGTLHYRPPDGQLNDYEKAITAVGGVIARYDADQQFPVLGFGAKYGGIIQHCFQIGSKPELDGIAGVLEAYRGVFRTGLTMSGPTVFAEVIDFAAAMARSNQEASKMIGKQSYKILMILTDGEVTDVAETKRAIHAASDAPLSIVIVGIGNADFSVMQNLDDFQDLGQGGGRDIVQFVQFSEHANNRSSLTRATLEEIPDQLVDYFTSKGMRPFPPISGSQFSLQAEDPTDEDIDLSLDVGPDGEISLGSYSGTVYDDTKYATFSDYSTLKPMALPSAPAPYQTSAPFNMPPSSNPYGQQPAAPYQSYGQQLPMAAQQQPSSNPYVQRPAAPYQSYGQPQPVAAQQPVKSNFFLVQVPANVKPGTQLQVQNPATKLQMVVTVPQGVAPGSTFPVEYVKKYEL